MAREMPTTAYTEVQIDEDSISLTLISESGSNGAVVEDTERFTFEELQSLSGEHSTLRLSDESAEALVEGRRLAMKGQILDSQPQVSEGDVLTDENAPHWSSNDWVEVVEVLDKSADRYVIEGPNEGPVPDGMPLHFHDRTVAEANPSYPDDDTVVIAQYAGTGKHYAFPISRLK